MISDDVAGAIVHLRVGVWAGDDGDALERAVAGAAFAHAGALLGWTDLCAGRDGWPRGRCRVTRAELLWACRAAANHRPRGPSEDDWGLLDRAVEEAAAALASAVVLLTNSE